MVQCTKILKIKFIHKFLCTAWSGAHETCFIGNQAVEKSFMEVSVQLYYYGATYFTFGPFWLITPQSVFYYKIKKQSDSTKIGLIRPTYLIF